MPETITRGTVTAQPGTLQCGRWEALDHSTGHVKAAHRANTLKACSG